MSPDKSKQEEIERDRAFIKEYIDRVVTTLRRAEDLIQIAENSFPKDRPSQIKDDILRAAVVFLHATLEDFLRFIGSRFIPLSNDEDVLNKISLSGSSDVLHPEKFLLGKLAKHRGKTVDELIAESVQAHFEKRSFSKTDRISETLESAGIPTNEVKKFYPSLGELMARRHQIVHAADLETTHDKEGERGAAPIDVSKVKEWFDTMFNFVNAVAADKLRVGV